MGGDELNVGSDSMMKIMPTQQAETKKAAAFTEIVSGAKNNRQALRRLEEQGYAIKEIRNNETGKTYPPPTGFMNLTGLNKMDDVTITAVKDGETVTKKIDWKFNGEMDKAVRNHANTKAAIKFVNDSNMSQEDKDQANKFIENKDWTGLYNILDKNDLLGKFMEWMARELQKMAGTSKLPTGGEAQMQYLGERTEDAKQDKAERDLAERVDDLRKKYGGKED